MQAIALAVCLAIALCVKGQVPEEPAQKIGHADWQYIFSKLPEYAQLENELKIFEGKLKEQIKFKGQELEAKMKAYESLPADTPETIRRDKESELSYLQENIRRFQQEAAASLQRRQSDLAAPIFAKVGKAIEEVAAENGYTYIFNPRMNGNDVLLFSSDKYNISDLVLRKLGISTAR